MEQTSKNLPWPSVTSGGPLISTKHHSTQMRPMPPSPNIPMRFTPITGRVSRAKSGVPVHVCDICTPAKTFTRAEHLRRHQLSHQTPGYPCTFPGCDRAFHRPDLLTRHQQRHEQEGDLLAKITAPVARPSPILGPFLELPEVTREQKISPLDLPIPLVSPEREAEDWSEEELRGFLREILEKKQGIEDAVDEIIVLLTPLARAEVEGHAPPAQRSDKRFIMNRFLRGSDTWTISDSGFASLDRRALNPMYLAEPDSSLPPAMVGARQISIENTKPAVSGIPPTLWQDAETLSEKGQPGKGLEKPQLPTEPSAVAVQLLAPPPVSETLANNARIAQNEFTGRKQNDLVIQGQQTPDLFSDLTMAIGCVAEESSITSEADDTTSASSSSTSVLGYLNFLVLGDAANDMNGTLIKFYESLIDAKLGFRRCQDGRSRGDGQNSATPNSMPPPGTAGASKVNAGKRVRTIDDEDKDHGESDDEGNGSGGRKRKRSRADGNNIERKIACPYMKRYPVQFSDWRTCLGPGFPAINRLKEHLKRRHFKENVCSRCGLQLENSSSLQDHLRATEPCKVKDLQPQLGFMTQPQFDAIQGKRTRDGEDISGKWKYIYQTLFPDVDDAEVPGPYFDIMEASQSLRDAINPREYENYRKRHLPMRILHKLNQEFQFIADQAKKRLVEIVQEESAEIMKEYLLSKGLHQAAPTDTTAVEQNANGQDMIEPATAPPRSSDVVYGAQWLDPSMLDTIDIFCQPFGEGFPELAPITFSWPPQDKQAPSDSAYGSNDIDQNSTEAA